MLVSFDNQGAASVAVPTHKKSVFVFPPGPARLGGLSRGLLDNIAREFTRLNLTAPIGISHGAAQYVFVVGDKQRGQERRFVWFYTNNRRDFDLIFNTAPRIKPRKKKHAWTRHANEDQARFFFACAPGQLFTTDEEARTNG